MVLYVWEVTCYYDLMEVYMTIRVDRIIRDLSVILYDFVLITLKMSLLSDN